MKDTNTHKNRHFNTKGLTDEEIALAKDCIEKIMHSKSLNEVMEAWTRAQKFVGVIIAVHKAVGDIMVNVACGRDARFLTEDLHNYFDYAKTIS